MSIYKDEPEAVRTINITPCYAGVLRWAAAVIRGDGVAPVRPVIVGECAAYIRATADQIGTIHGLSAADTFAVFAECADALAPLVAEGNTSEPGKHYYANRDARRAYERAAQGEWKEAALLGEAAQRHYAAE